MEPDQYLQMLDAKGEAGAKGSRVSRKGILLTRKVQEASDF